MTMTEIVSHEDVFGGFQQSDFQVFQLEGLEERMKGIQTHIQPKFRMIGTQLQSELAILAGNEMHLHIAKHARRKVNPPKDTWLAICANKRGYKAHPHFQLGLFDDHVFIWFALIYEVPNKQVIASRYIKKMTEVISSVPGDFVLSQDHMKKEATSVKDMNRKDWTATLTRFRDVGKAELLIGRHIAAGDPILTDGDALVQYITATYTELIPLYHLACSPA